MNMVDAGFVVILLLSALVGVWRGLLREVLSIVSWVAAGYLAYRYHPLAAQLLEQWIAEPTVRRVLAIVGVFVLAALVFALLSHALASVIHGTPLRGVDRGLGALFGIARGALVIAVTVLVVDASSLRNESAWQGSMLVEYARPAAEWLRALVGPYADELKA